MGRDDSLPPVPRESRTPITVAGEVLSELCGVWLEWTQERPGDEEDRTLFFFESIFGEMWDDEATSGDAYLTGLDDFAQTAEEIEDGKLPPRFIVFLATCAYAVQAMRAQKIDANVAVGWSYAADASYWLGITKASGGPPTDDRSALSALGRRASDARHAENRAMRKAAIDFYEANRHRFKSIDSAAEAIAGKVVPVKFRTVQQWISAHRRSLRSTGTP